MGLANGAPQSPRAPRTRRAQKSSRGTWAKRGQVLKAIRKTIKTLDGQFTFDTVAQAVGKQFPSLEIKRSSLKGTLKKLAGAGEDRKSTRLNSSHLVIS